MSSERPARLSYEESCKFLQRHHHLRAGAIPAMPDGRPDIYGGGGVQFFRTWIGVGRPFGLAPSRPEDDVEVAEHALAGIVSNVPFWGYGKLTNL